MATYVMIGKYSLDALGEISAKRTEKAIALMGRYRGSFEAAYALLGENDLLLIANFPDTEAAIQASVELTKSTGISFSTMPAVSVAEFDRIVEEGA